MLYGLLGDHSGITDQSLLTQHQVLGKDDRVPWLTTNKKDAEQKASQRDDPNIKVVVVWVSPFVPWEPSKEM